MHHVDKLPCPLASKWVQTMGGTSRCREWRQCEIGVFFSHWLPPFRASGACLIISIESNFFSGVSLSTTTIFWFQELLLILAPSWPSDNSGSQMAPQSSLLLLYQSGTTLVLPTRISCCLIVTATWKRWENPRVSLARPGNDTAPGAGLLLLLG